MIFFLYKYFLLISLELINLIIVSSSFINIHMIIKYRISLFFIIFFSTITISGICTVLDTILRNSFKTRVFKFNVIEI